MVMGRRRPAPPAPPATPPSPAYKAKDYKTERPSEVTDELDMLRSRGMAKILNKHFTDTTKKLAHEKAEADAALADLERRRKQTSEFVPSQGGGGLNPFDAMYVELQHKRAACRRKEQETMLLYQRYVHKYGKKVKIDAPKPASLLVDQKSSAQATAPPPSLPKSKPLQPLDEHENENAESVVESVSVVSDEVQFSKFYNKQLAERTSKDDDAQPDPPALNCPDPPGDKTSKGSAANKEVKPTEAVANDADLPDLAALTPQTGMGSQLLSIPHAENILLPDTKIPDPKPDAPEMDARVANDSTRVEENHISEAENASDDVEPTTDDNDKPKEENPPKDSRPDAEAKESGESDSGGSPHLPAIEVLTEVPSAEGTSDDEETDIRSIISGLTSVNDASARQVMDGMMAEMNIFIQTETEEIQKLLEKEEEQTYVSNFHNSSGSVACDESVQVALKAEAMAQEMQKIIDDFKKEDSSTGGSVSQHDTDDKSTSSHSGYPRKFETPDPNEEWIVYYDETHQREYYHETKTNRTQWTPPTAEPKARFDQQVISSDDMMQETMSPRGGLVRKKSRRSIYRKKMRKRRIRRFVAFSFILACFAASCWHWKANHPDKSYPEAMQATFHSIDFKGRAVSIKHRLEYTFTDRKVMEESERIKLEEQARRAREQKARIEAKKKAQEEAERKRLEKVALEIKAKEEAHKKEIELRAKEAKKQAEEEARRRQLELEAEQRAMEERKALQRPWGCHIPLSYAIHPRCRRLTRLNPMYKETDIVNSFMQ